MNRGYTPTVYHTNEVNVQRSQVGLTRFLLLFRDERAFLGNSGVGNDMINATLLSKHLLKGRGLALPG
jgi:hypothetical protein